MSRLLVVILLMSFAPVSEAGVVKQYYKFFGRLSDGRPAANAKIKDLKISTRYVEDNKVKTWEQSFATATLDKNGAFVVEEEQLLSDETASNLSNNVLVKATYITGDDALIETAKFVMKPRVMSAEEGGPAQYIVAFLQVDIRKCTSRVVQDDAGDYIVTNCK